MTDRTCLSIILAAGEGTRMQARRPKVLHKLAGRSLIAHVLDNVSHLGGRAAVVVGPDQPAVSAEVRALAPGSEIFVQRERRGTANAVLAARAAIAQGADDILVVFADTPLVRIETLDRLRGALAAGAAVAVLGFYAADPAGYGRLIVEGNRLLAIREDKDASPAERANTFCNGGLMALAGAHALAILDEIDDRNAKHEFYLTDAVRIARNRGLDAVALETAEDEVRGVNTQAQLAEAEGVLQARLRQAALAAGVAMTAPDTVYLAADTRFGRDVMVEPFVVMGPGVVVDDGAVIRAFCRLENTRIGRGEIVGPHAHIGTGKENAAEDDWPVRRRASGKPVT